jgi:7-carboxy-7-deazaguanine synthase
MRCPGWPCDTEHAINPKIWRFESEKVDPMELAVRINEEGVENICLTGGEPFMQPNADLWELCNELLSMGHELEVFTNGSYKFPEWALASMNFVMDWKLQGSGEADTNRPIRLHNALDLGSTDVIKFVVKDKDDLNEALALTVLFRSSHPVSAQLWVGAAWGCISEAEVIDYMKEHGPPWKLNVQMHKFIFDPNARRT